MSLEKTHLLYAGAIGLLLSDIIPTPADVIVFDQSQKNKLKLEKGEITPKQYWQRETFNYYAINPIWWSLVLAATVYLGTDFKQKRNILLGLIAGGAVIAVIHKNIKKDEEFYGTHQLVSKPNLLPPTPEKVAETQPKNPNPY